MIGGFIFTGMDSSTLAIRGIGPSLEQVGITAFLGDPALELRDANGTALVFNNDWQDDPSQATELIKHGLSPQDTHEAGVVAALLPGAYTVILSDYNGEAGVGLVEIYQVK